MVKTRAFTRSQGTVRDSLLSVDCSSASQGQHTHDSIDETNSQISIASSTSLVVEAEEDSSSVSVELEERSKHFIHGYSANTPVLSVEFDKFGTFLGLSWISILRPQIGAQQCT